MDRAPGDEIGRYLHGIVLTRDPLEAEFDGAGVTEGRGSVVFRVYVDGKEKASSGLMNGVRKPKALKVDKLEGARRLILSVTDAEDGNRDDLANWVDGKLYLR